MGGEDTEPFLAANLQKWNLIFSLSTIYWTVWAQNLPVCCTDRLSNLAEFEAKGPISRL